MPSPDETTTMDDLLRSPIQDQYLQPWQSLSHPKNSLVLTVTWLLKPWPSGKFVSFPSSMVMQKPSLTYSLYVYQMVFGPPLSRGWGSPSACLTVKPNLSGLEREYRFSVYAYLGHLGVQVPESAPLQHKSWAMTAMIPELPSSKCWHNYAQSPWSWKTHYFNGHVQ